ncbi:MAG: elongation factor Ts [Erysipelotrichaceae bacterium]|jgi:elongation factor Ts|nr:translation elongation factor Ts [Bacilli bacterium]NLV28974.1 elongation factor Ts [Erysipelotrichaceae bacterium]HPY79986.1 translation elongation factor Ts [Bacilli bacterium]HQA56076.1 translation elongation factor Ts [Bacilli bacterium]
MAEKSLIDLIKDLRERTGAGLMDCKAALLASGNDIEKASDFLREKGLVKMAKKASRIAAEGLTVFKSCAHCRTTVIVEVNCETDFVAKGDAFHDLVNTVADLLLDKKPATIEEARELTASLFTDATVKLGEKLDLRRFELVTENGDEFAAPYTHMGGKISVVVLLDKNDAEFGKQLAMHIAANNPSYLAVDEIPEEVIKHETEVETAASKNDEKLANKPAPVLEKIIANKVNKRFAEVTLLAQAFLIDDSKTVEQVLKEKNTKVLKFVRYQVGEGIEKRQDDFASEVMSQVN